MLAFVSGSWRNLFISILDESNGVDTDEALSGSTKESFLAQNPGDSFRNRGSFKQLGDETGDEDHHPQAEYGGGLGLKQHRVCCCFHTDLRINERRREDVVEEEEDEFK